MKREYIIAAIFFVVLTVIIFWKALLQNLIPFPGDYLIAWYEPWKADHFINNAISIAHKAVADDIFRHLYPLRLLTVEVMKNQQWPLWNPYNGAGSPLMAIMHPGYFNPFGLVFFFFKPETAWLLFLAIQPVLLGFCTYIYCRKINISPPAAFFSSASLVLSGFAIARLEFAEFLYVLSGLPLLLWTVEAQISSRTPVSLLLIPPVILFLFVSGQPHMILYVAIFAWLYAVYRFLQTETEKKLVIRNIILYTSTYVLGAMLAAFQLLPSIELYRLSTITQASSQFIFNRFLVPVSHLLSVLIPNFFGNQATYNYWGSGDYLETVASVGVIPCFFALLAAGYGLKHQRKIIGFFVAAAITTLILVINWFGSRWFYTLGIPVLSADVPSRIFVLTTFSISILAGLGLNQLIINDKPFPIKLIKIYTLLILSILISMAFFVVMKLPCRSGIVTNCYTVGLRNTILETAFYVIFIAIFFLRYKLNNPKKGRLFSIIIILIIITAGVYNSNKFLPFSKTESILPTNNILNVLIKTTEDARIFGLGKANLKTNLSTHFRLFDPNYYDPLHNKRYAELIYFANTGKILPVLPRSDVEIDAEATPSAEINSRRERLFDLLSIKYLLYKKEEYNSTQIDKSNTVWGDNNWLLLRRNQTIPRVYFVKTYEVISDDNSILNRLFDPAFNHQQSVILEKIPALVQPTQLNTGTAAIKKYSENEVLITTETDSRSILILTDNYYPGWSVYIDGVKETIYRANYSFRAVIVPQGIHSIKFIFEPLSLKIGLVISLFSLVIYLGTILGFLILRKVILKSSRQV